MTGTSTNCSKKIHTFCMDLEIGRFVCQHSFGLDSGPEHVDFARVAGRRFHVDAVRRLGRRHAGKVDVHRVRSFDGRLVRGRVSLTPVVVEHEVDLRRRENNLLLLLKITIEIRLTYRFGFSFGVFHSDVDCSFARGERLDGKVRFCSHRRTGRFDSRTVHANAVCTRA